ncbi:polyprenyl synthetase family protein [Bacillus sp. HMF5848]|uniref:polyprenyl synthetase family protein n=1 Tax=Bacillus sp. HMF5848 TaxID=2495421 RepID=UPI000F7A1413|nr:polyprenyl synthetase family protein [Bacillus sp. HMF5848]RSK25870.1 polyprenyl synthetase family protein [Bacillus sp. HMF5848]
MQKELIMNFDECYEQAELKANAYFTELYEQATEKAYIPTLIDDIKSWKQSHIHHPFVALLSYVKGKPDTQDFYNYIRWQEKRGKLDNYLDRSVSYIFMRDLGRALDSPDTQARIARAVNSLKKNLTKLTQSNRDHNAEPFSMAGLYRKAQKAGIESTMIWLVSKLKTVYSQIPEGMDAEQSQRKLIKLIAGVLMHVMEEMEPGVSSEERRRKLDEAIRLGYSYGLTYPLIDDLLDANILSEKETRHFSNLIRTTLLTGIVPKLGEWPGKNKDFMQFVYSELQEAFEYIKIHQRPDRKQSFLEQSYVFFNSQEIDRDKDLSNPNYTNEDIYIPVILKSASSRLIVRSIINAPEDEGFDNRTFFYGIYNQLADDFTDMFEDMRLEAVTPYTYYLKYHDVRKDLINPFELYWTVISHLIHNVYCSDTKTCEVILDRAINSLKRCKVRLGVEKYNEIMGLLTAGIPELNRVLQAMVHKADDVDFFDKLLRDHIITNLKNERKEQEDFLQTAEAVRLEINNILNIPKIGDSTLLKDSITDAANYSLAGDGKRLRPILTWVMGVNEYGLDKLAIIPLLRSLEYMHTASLIFDDLPSQDNAPLRRGRPTLHQVYNISISELTGLFLTQRAVEEQASLDKFDPKTVLNLILYSSQITQLMCKGQEMDLDSRGKSLNLEELNTLSLYKTGIAFEASLVMPAILAHAKESEIEALKTFARHAGIAFQIKDDLLDVDGDSVSLGKPTGQDAENNNSTFVSVLGQEGAKQEMWEHYCLAMEALHHVPRNTSFLKQLLNYMINRDR